jgi:hypothetical protein
MQNDTSTPLFMIAPEIFAGNAVNSKFCNLGVNIQQGQYSTYRGHQSDNFFLKNEK